MNLLSLSFGKYIDANLCCFIPGKIIDEIYHVLKILKTNCDPPSTYEVLQVSIYSFIVNNPLPYFFLKNVRFGLVHINT